MAPVRILGAMNYRVAAPLLLSLSLLPSVGCDKATPVAPNGTILTISANPSKVALNGRSTITVVGRKPDGNPLNPGTEIRLTVDKGTLADTIVTADSNGRATTTFRADGRTGVAKITAMTGGGMTMATTDLQVGESADTKPTVLVSVAPNNIPVGTGDSSKARVTIIARNSDGTPLAGQRIILTTSLGTITPDRPVTQSDGTAQATLTAGTQGGMATITAVAGSSDPVTAMLTIRDVATNISLQSDRSSITRSAGGTITLTAFVSNAQQQPVQGAAVTFTSTVPALQSSLVFTNVSGQAINTLTVEPGDIPAGVTQITVTASTPTAPGQPSLTSSVRIAIL